MSQSEIQSLKIRIALSDKICQWKVAEKLGISESKLSRILRGRLEPSPELMGEVNRLLNSKFFK